tara:strand:- start:75 stop:347 length:273 start_codon:yes stop_codon:yes gene_type:complete
VKPGPALAGIDVMAMALVMMAMAKVALAIFFDLRVMVFSSSFVSQFYITCFYGYETRGLRNCHLCDLSQASLSALEGVLGDRNTRMVCCD